MLYAAPMATLGEVGERKLVGNILSIVRPRSANTVIGIGDDAAVLKGASDGSIVISTDVVTKERHFPEGMTFEQFGWTSAAVSFSDIASMGAKPLGMVSAITMPDDSDESELYDVVSGIDQCCEYCDTDLVGGDTKYGQLAIAATAIGTMEGRKPLTRDGAQPGDMIAVTGPVGNAAAGYYALKNGIDADDQIFSLMTPVPRTKEGIGLASTGIVTSCMDLSDGLSNAASAVCKASHVGMEFEWEFLPIEDDAADILKECHMDVEDTVLRWGGEYELMFTFGPQDVHKLYDAEIPFSIVGVVNNGTGPVLRNDNGTSEMRDAIY